MEQRLNSGAPGEKPRVCLDTNQIGEQESGFAAQLDAIIVGQPNAKQAAARAYRNFLNPLRDTTRPVYAILALGPSSTGKTLTARALAQILHGNPDALLMLDGSNYMHDHQLVGLTGAPRSYIGYVDPKNPQAKPAPDEKDPYAELSPHNLIWSRKGSSTPVTIVLVDEWEKASRKFNEVMLRILRDGKITLGNGVEVDLRQCIFIFTSNLGTSELESMEHPLGFRHDSKGVSHRDIEAVVTKHLKQFAPPEFRNRILESGEIVIYDRLTEDEMYAIVEREIAKIELRIAASGVVFQLTVDDQAKHFILARALSDKGGVANLKGVVNVELADKLGGELIKGAIGSGDKVEVTYVEGQECLSFFCSKASPTGQSEVGPTTAASATPADGSQTTCRALAIPEESPQYALVHGIPTNTGGVLVPMGSLVFIAKSHEAKQEAERNPGLKSGYVVRVTGNGVSDELMGRFLSLFAEFKNMLGVDVLQNVMRFAAPGRCVLQIQATPRQLEVIKSRYPDIEVYPANQTPPPPSGK